MRKGAFEPSPASRQSNSAAAIVLPPGVESEQTRPLFCYAIKCDRADFKEAPSIDGSTDEFGTHGLKPKSQSKLLCGFACKENGLSCSVDTQCCSRCCFNNQCSIVDLCGGGGG